MALWESRPTHPELLDYLASEFVRERLAPETAPQADFDVQHLPDVVEGGPKAALAKDPENDLLWRFDMQRLSAEEVRDSVLAVSGNLNLKMFGPSILVKLPPEVLAGQSVPGAGWGESSPEEQARRSVYIKSKRSLAVPILASFDAPESDATCPVRFATTQPTQALGMMNSVFLEDQSKLFAATILRKAGTDPTAQVRFALWQVFQRAPTEREITRGVRLISDLKQKDSKTSGEALADFCLVVLNLNEFLYLD